MFRDTGARASELVSIEQEWLDLDRNQCFVKKLKIKQLVECPGCGHKSGRTARFCPECGGDLTSARTDAGRPVVRRRIVAITDETAELLRLYLPGRAAASLWLFPSAKDPSKHIHRKTASYIVTEAANAVGLGGKILDHPEYDTQHYVSPHRLRDAMAIEDFKRDPSMENLRVLAYKLGHTPETTYKHYIKLVGAEI